MMHLAGLEAEGRLEFGFHGSRGEASRKRSGLCGSARKFWLDDAHERGTNRACVAERVWPSVCGDCVRPSPLSNSMRVVKDIFKSDFATTL